MKKLSLFVLTPCLLVAMVACSQEAGEATTGAGPAPLTEKPESLKDKVAYGIGLNLARNLKQQGIDPDPELISQGLRDGLGGTALLTDAEIQAAMQAFQQELAQAMLKPGQEFLEANKAKEGVVVLPSGLQYQVLVEGSGSGPKDTDQVKVHYRGTFIDGKEFDSSYKSGNPVTFPVRGVIRGWTEALLLMKPGAKWKLFIPPDLAYGAQGRPGIPPNSTLLFEVELLEIISP